MNQFIQQLSNLSLGQAILIACSVLLSLFVVAVLKQLFSTKSPSKSSGKLSPVNPVRIDPVLNQTLTKAEKLEDILNEDIATLKHNLEQERVEVTEAAKALKALAIEKRIPETLFQIYSEMKAFPKKSKESQETDMEWHRKVGVSDLKVEPIIGENGIIITFVLLRHLYRISAITHTYARIHFVELTLSSSEDVKLMVVRVKPEETLGRGVVEKAVMEMRKGEWIDDIIACRLLMDKRQTELDLLAGHREVEQLKDKFAFNPLKKRNT